MKRKHQILQYIVGLLVMSFGVVLIKEVEIGISPVTTIASALSNISSLSMGKTLIIFQLICFVIMVIIQRKLDLKTALTVPVAIGFGYMVDVYMYFVDFGNPVFAVRCVICIIGIMVMALGITIIVGSDLMLPPPDALLRTISKKYNKKLSNVKFAGDAIWVGTAAVIELVFLGRIPSIGLGSLFSVLLTGRLIGLYTKLFPRIILAV